MNNTFLAVAHLNEIAVVHLLLSSTANEIRCATSSLSLKVLAN
jgi:hypothetical protein